MSSQLLEILNGVKTMSIVGMCKNAGKPPCSTGCCTMTGSGVPWG